LDRTREPIFNVPAVIVALLAVLGLVHGVRELVLSDRLDRDLILNFAFFPARYDSNPFTDGVLPGGLGASLWSFVSYAAIHADLTHLGFNAIWLLAFGSPVARRFGAARFLIFFAATSAAGALAHLLTNPGSLHPMIGASAAISGTMGAATRFAFEPGGPLDMWRRERTDVDRIPAAPLLVALRNPRVLTFLAVWFGLNLLFGLSSLPLFDDNQAVAWQAHVGGFLAGLLLFSAFDPVDPRPQFDPGQTLH
jgi:membrane associated rhomboid family serine protease